MSEPLDPRRKQKKTGPVGDEDVYGLADSDADDPVEDPTSASRSFSDDDSGLDEAESPEPRRSTGAPVAPLPRLWKSEPDPVPEPVAKKAAPEPEAKRKSAPPSSGGRPKASRSGGIERVGTVKRSSDQPAASKTEGQRRRPTEDKGSSSKEGGGVLVEETPNLDTYAARKTARMIFGFAALAFFLVGGFIFIRGLISRAGGNSEAAKTDAVPVEGLAPQPTRNLEAEARMMFRRAEDLARKGNVPLAVSLLTKVTESYPGTNSAREAKEALARPKKNLPLFLDGPAVVATAAETKTKAVSTEVAAPKGVVPEPSPKAAVASVTPAPTPAPAVMPAEEALRPGQAAGPPSAAVFAPGTPAAEPSVGRPLPKGFRSKPGTQVDASGWPLEIVGDRDDNTMVLVPGGSFVMGRDDGELAERPAHQVRVSTFYIDQHEVTVRQYENFQRAAGRRADRDLALAREESTPPSSEDSPVVMVSAKDARDYAGWAHKKLPTEAQWEMAARGTDGRPHPWGLAPPDWGKKREPRKLTPVMSYSSDVSPYGVYDMAGNAWEWTKDWYDSRYYQVIKGKIPDDPAGPFNRPPSQELVVKGGSKNWFITSREGLRHEKRLKYVGFRCVLAVEGPDNAFDAGKPATPAPEGNQVLPGGVPAGGTPF